MSSAQKRPGQLQKHLGEMPDMTVVLHTYHLVRSFKPCRKLSCFTEGQSPPSWAYWFILWKVLIFQREKGPRGGLQITKMEHKGEIALSPAAR